MTGAPPARQEENRGLQTLLEGRSRFLSFLQGRVGNREDAEEILQSAYGRALESEAQPADDGVIRWFYRVLSNAVIDHYRRRGARAGALEAYARELETSVDQEDLRSEVCRCVLGILENLKPEYAEILRRVELEGESSDSFARQSGITPNNARVRAHRSRAALRRELIATCGACAEHQCLDCRCRHETATHGGSSREV